jgi:hypothetical protein
VTLLVPCLVVGLVACGPDSSPSATPGAASPSAGVSSGAPGPSPTPTPVPGSSSAAPTGTVPPQADTSWGRIWEGLPANFPHFAGAEPTEVGGNEPTSATLDIPTSAGTVEDVVAFYHSAIEAAGYSVSDDGPLENGGYTISATGQGGCALQVSVDPLGGSITVTVLYGAFCPIE